jgi:hypothetical protein
MLKLKNPRMKGPGVRRLQEMLESIGYKIETDGVFGPQTDRAVKNFQFDNGLTVDGIVGRTTRRALRDCLDGSWYPRQHLPGNIFPLGNHPKPRLYAGRREWNQINGVVLHQTGCKMPLRPSGWQNLNAHIGVTEEGMVVVVNAPQCKIWHAQGLSQSTIGIEIAGNFHGVEGKKNTLWKGGGPAATLNPNQLEGVNAAMNLVQFWFNEQCQEWKYIYAHRQSSKTRAGDPGSEIWQQVAMPWIKKLGLSEGGENFKRGSGRPIPREWNSEYKNNRYWG